jgi:magnesium transporter
MITIYTQLHEKEFVKTLTLDELVIYLKDPKSVFWIDLSAPTEEEIMRLQNIFNFHPLCIEDCMTYSNAPKLDEFDEYIFLVTHEPEINLQTNELHRPELDFFLGKNYLVSVHHHQSAAVEKAIHRCDAQLLFHQSSQYEKTSLKSALKDNTMFRNSDLILHAILDHIVDSYFPLIDRWDDTIESAEDRVMASVPEKNILQEILAIKRQLSAFRRLITPQRDIMARLIHSESKALSKASNPYFRDVYDHLIRVTEMLDGHRDAMGNVLEAYYSVLSYQINENSQVINFIMQRLTIITTIFMPLSFIASVYGMNFENMPEKNWTYGYYAVLIIMTITAALMILFFRKKKWI